MAAAQMDTVIRYLRRAVLRQDGAGLTDSQLLASFIDQKDEAAFEALVRRHGPMVFGVCRRVVRNHHDAEDAFQATFLVLARKASSVRPRDRLSNWLHGVALRTALKARTLTAKRRGREKQVTEMPEPLAAQQDHWLDLQPLLDQELNGLPENYRLPILLCDLGGKTIKEATQQLGWPQGTLAGRLARGRKLLAKRLANRGVVLSAISLSAVISHNAASVAVPNSLLNSTVKAVPVMAASQGAVAGAIPAKVALLTEGVLKAMLLSKLKTAMKVLILVGFAASGGVLFTNNGGGNPQARAEQPNSRIWPVAFVDAGTVSEAGAKHDAAKTDLDRLQGVWAVVSMECGGKPSKLDEGVFMVDGKRACWQTKDGETQGGLYLEPTSKPKTYDFAMSTRTIEGIYSLEGDTLRLCYNLGTDSKRPSGFITQKGSQKVLLVLKRTHGRWVFPFLLPDGTRAFPTFFEKEMTPRPPPRLIAPQPTQPKANKLNAYGAAEQPKDEQRNKTVTDVATSQEIRPPKAADLREYVITSRLLEPGADQPKEVLVLPRVTLDDGQPGGLRIMDGLQKLPAKVRIDEKFKVGTFFEVQVRHLEGNHIRLVVSFQRNVVEKLDGGEIFVLGNNVHAIQEIELHKPVKIVLQKDTGGSAQRWVEITVDELTTPQPAPPP